LKKRRHEDDQVDEGDGFLAVVLTTAMTGFAVAPAMAQEIRDHCDGSSSEAGPIRDHRDGSGGFLSALFSPLRVSPHPILLTIL
jgi:hypothetical protein